MQVQETRVAVIKKDEQGIVHITMKDCGKVDELDVVDVHLVLRHLSGDKPAYKLLDARASWSLTSKGKERARLGDLPENTGARAIVVSNGIKKALYRFLQEFSKKSYPQRFFTDYDEAYNWLLSVKREQEKSNG